MFATYCESHASDIPFHAVARLLRAVFGVAGHLETRAPGYVRDRFAACPDDLLLLDDLLGIRDPDDALPDRPGRAPAAFDGADQDAALARTTPARLRHRGRTLDRRGQRIHAGRFPCGDPATPSRRSSPIGPIPRRLAHVSGSQTIALAPLDDSETTALTTELLGEDPSVAGQVALIAGARPAIRSLPKRSCAISPSAACSTATAVITCRTDDCRRHVPGTLQAAIAARIDRLGADGQENSECCGRDRLPVQRRTS